MAELKDQIFEILKKPQLTSLATITEEGKPWVRYVMMMTAEDMTMSFATVVQARKVAQIKEGRFQSDMAIEREVVRGEGLEPPTS